MKIHEYNKILNEEPHLELTNNKFVDMGLERIRGKNKIEKSLKTIGILYRFIFKKHKLMASPHGDQFNFDYDTLDKESKQLVDNRYELEKDHVKNIYGEEKGNHLINLAIKKAKEHKHNHIYIGHSYFN